MNILITGSKGQLGTAMQQVLEHHRSKGANIQSVTAVDIDQLDLTDRAAVADFIAAGDFTHIVNCAAYTAVDAAEEHKAECMAVNIDAVKNLAAAAADSGARLVHISTDYVFDGETARPYAESAKPHPISEYGAAKRMGETALLGLLPDAVIIRTGWLYSPWGRNFLKTMLRLADENEQISVVSDQVGTPTYAVDLAEAIYAIISHRQWVSGIYHFSNEGVASWYDFTVAIIKYARRLGMYNGQCKVKPISTHEYPTTAARPPYSVLDKTLIKRTFGLTIPHWFDGVARCLLELQQLAKAEEEA